jgi:hypothetical protein
VDAVLELARELVEHLSSCAGNRDSRALMMKCPRDRVPDPTGRSGDERGLAGQIEH